MVDKYSVSSVFREMVSCAKSPRLELCDAAIETALTLTDFLNVVIHDDDQWMRAPLDTDITSVDRGCHLIAFLRKYECDKALSQIRRHLRYMCSLYSSGKTSHGPPFVFTFAAVLDDTDICTDALQATGSATWIRNPIHGDLGVPVHGYLSDPSTLPLYALKVIPPEYLWAWMRAYQHTFGASKDAGSKDSRKSGKDDKAMAAEFSRLMAVIEVGRLFSLRLEAVG